MTAVIEAENIYVRAGGRFLLQDVSIRIAAGETVAVIGPNGAGKSTLLRALSGEHEVCRGVVRFGGRPLSAYTPQHIALRRAVLSQNVSVSFPFTVAEIVHMGSAPLHPRRHTPSIDAAIGASPRSRIATDHQLVGWRTATNPFRPRIIATDDRRVRGRARTAPA